MLGYFVITNIAIDQTILSKDARNIIEKQNSFLLVNLYLAKIKESGQGQSRLFYY